MFEGIIWQLKAHKYMSLAQDAFDSEGDSTFQEVKSPSKTHPEVWCAVTVLCATSMLLPHLALNLPLMNVTSA